MSYTDREVLQICRTLAAKYANDFNGFVTDSISFAGLEHNGLTWQQEEIGQSVVDHKRVCVAAGGGIGKTAEAALLAIWFVATHPFSRVLTTATSGAQLKEALWSEINFWLRRCKFKEIFTLLSGKLYLNHFPDWYVTARTIPKDGDASMINDTLAGFHGTGGFMAIVDEASGVPDSVFTAIEGAMTGENSYILLISNPVSSGGYYYDTITDPKGKGRDYNVLYYSGTDSPLVTEKYIQGIITRYGKDSAMYKAKVMGQPISMLESVVVTPERYDLVTKTNRSQSQGNYIVSVDVGSTDKTVFCHRCGLSIFRWDVFDTVNPTNVSNEALRLYHNMYADKRVKFVIDGLGPGSGVVSNLEEARLFEVVSFKGSENSQNKAMYRNCRTEGYYELSKEFDKMHFPATPPERLKKELANLKFDFSKGPIEMEPKKKFISRLGFSPDHADALMMNISADKVMGMLIKPHVSKRISRKLRTSKKSSKYGRFAKFCPKL